VESVASCYPLLAVKACFHRAAQRWLPIFVTTPGRHFLWAPQIVRSKRDTQSANNVMDQKLTPGSEGLHVYE
jgi:hypothetical protein